MTMWVFFTAFSLTLLTGCAAVSESAIGKVASEAMETVGLKKPDIPDAQKPPRTVQISLNAGNNLNASQNQPLAVVVKIYKLKNANTFMQAPLNSLTDAALEKVFLGADLLEQRDITLLPGQQYNVAEKVTKEAGAIGVVALFHSPAPRRWKFVFDAASAEKTGIKLGVHACAMTVVSGEVSTPPGALKEEALNQLSLVKCS
jgi:type VI secretion system protein VasD